MPFATTLRAHTTVHANRDLLETEETAAKVKLLLSSSFSLSLSSPLESLTAPIPLAFAKVFVRVRDSLNMMYEKKISIF